MACTKLQNLNCSSTLVTDLGPLASCTGLKTLYCNSMRVSDVRPLVNCTGLADVVCDPHVPVEQVQLLQAACTYVKVTRGSP